MAASHIQFPDYPELYNTGISMVKQFSSSLFRVPHRKISALNGLTTPARAAKFFPRPAPPGPEKADFL